MHRDSQRKGIRWVLPWLCVQRAKCAGMPTATPASTLVNVSSLARRRAREPKRKSPKLLSLVQRERSVKAEGVTDSQDAKGEKPPSMVLTGHGTGNGYGTTRKGKRRRMGTRSLSIPPILRPSGE